jgi:hypothetical protein
MNKLSFTEEDIKATFPNVVHIDTHSATFMRLDFLTKKLIEVCNVVDKISAKLEDMQIEIEELQEKIL